MPYLSSYKLEEVCDKKEKLFVALESIALIMKLASILLLILLWRYFYIGIAVWIASMALSLFKRDLIYKYVYVVDDGVLKIIRTYNAEKSIVVKRIDIAEDVESVDLTETGTKYYERTVNTPITINLYDGERISIAVDDYFRGLLDYYGRKNDISR